jgi:hypothetical protein
MQMRMHKMSVAGVVACLAGVAVAQPVVGPQQIVDPNNVTGAGVNETSVSVADANTDHIVGGWNDYRQQIRSVFSRSYDGGQTWFDEEIRPPAPYRTSVEGDPMMAHDHRDGTLYAGAMAFGGNGGIYIARKDPGDTFFQPSVMARISGSVDKGWMCVGPDPADLDDDARSILYVAYNQGLSRSSDRGVTWQGPVSLGSGLGFLPRVGPSGTLYVLNWEFNSTNIVMRTSTNGGQTIGPRRVVANRLDVWGIDGSRYPGNFRVPPLAYLAVDPVDETLYVVYFDTTQVVGGNRDTDLYFTMSENGGTSWTTPKIINGDAGNPRADCFFPWIEVDRTGRIGIVFYDTRHGNRDDSAGSALIDTYFTYSEDRGQTWNEIRLTPAPWDSVNDGLGGRFVGDYLGMGQARGEGGDYYWPMYLSGQAGRPNQYVNKIYFPCVADFNADEEVNTLDVLDFLNAWNLGDPRADINGDGEVNTLDVLEFLNDWNDPCSNS